MKQNNPMTILCISSYEKGAEFMKQAKKEGCKVILITSQSLENADWPRESIDQIYYIADVQKEWKKNDLIYSASYLARSEKIDRIVALDDYDVEKAAALREHLRVPGMGDTTVRYFRDKLAMRKRAKEVGILVPDFIHVLNYDALREFMNTVSPPWVLKPRLHAGAIGIKKIHEPEELWRALDELGDEQSFYLLETYLPGKIYHVDTIIFNNEVQFSIAHEYGLPPLEVAHEGRVFSSRTMLRDSEKAIELRKLNAQVLKGMGLVQGVSHTEFIEDNDGKIYFLETSARVGGAHIAELVEAESGINLWAEWAKIEVMKGEGTYTLPKVQNDYAAILLSLAKQEHPDLSFYNDPEIVWRLNKKYHAGLIIKSESKEKVESMLVQYTERFYNDFFARHDMQDRPVD
jgi:biotin carboxylase